MKNDSLWRDIALGVGAVLVVGFVGSRLSAPTVPVMSDRPQGLSVAAQTKLDTSASVTLFGQFRSGMADFLYMKADKYLHNGVEIRGTTQAEQKAAVARVQSAKGEDAALAHDGAETTAVPAKPDDWRGILGDIERETQPFQDMRAHAHKDPKESLPLYRLMTVANPQFIPGYTVGAAMIALDKTKIGEALAFLREGEKNNPQSFEIKTEIGMMYDTKFREYGKAEKPLIEALQIAEQRDKESLTGDEKEAWQNAFRFLVLAYRYQGKREPARQAAVLGLQRFPDDVTCLKQLQIERDGTWREYVDAGRQ
ncbi:MAG: hypothetical protein H7Y38_20550 [Armatimonadetes bacterium]|nr:hypothetical protein [Armatimonadota bacterium]